ncbi:BglG family transcription antiterminator [Brevibacillus sp. SYP-B805]|nr:BglG family transcription antiterminator [Brevibacillus sp. SYP-B805]
MATMLDKRTMHMLQFLVQSRRYVSIKDLMEHFSISRRTLYYDMDKINYWLKQAGLPPVPYIYAKGFYLDEASRQAIAQMTGEAKPVVHSLRARERQMYLLLYLLVTKERITTRECMEKTGASRNTILLDIRQIKEELNPYGLALSYSQGKGYEIVGDEMVSRKVWSHYAQFLLHNGHEPLLHELLQEGHGEVPFPETIHQWLAECEKHLQLQFAEDAIKQLGYLFSFTVKRVMAGHLVRFPPGQVKHVKTTRHYRVITSLERLVHTVLPEHEKCYMATLLLSAKVNEFGPSMQHNEMPFLQEAIKKMVDLFEMRACVAFDQREELERNLYIHLQPAYYRLIYNMDAANPLTGVIQQQYRDIYELTKKCIAPLEQVVGKPVNEDELAYITVHFGGWMRRQGVTVRSPKRVLLVCANGVGTSRILAQQLEGLFSNIDLIGPLTLRQYKQFQEDVDMVISTTNIENPRHRVIFVQPILTDRDKVHLLQEMDAISQNAPATITAQTIVDIVKKYTALKNEAQLLEEIKQALQQQRTEKHVRRERKPVLDELLRDECIQLKDQVSDWKEAIRVAAEPLLENRSITEEYVQAMIRNVEENGPYVVIAPKVALPHARPEQGVNRIGMSLLRLKKPVSFSEELDREAQLIIVLAAVDNETHLKALSQLSMMLSDDNNIDRLIAADEKETIQHLIATYSKQ